MIKGIRGGKLNFLQEVEIKRIHEGALDVLEKTGVITDSDKIAEIISGAGAKVTQENEGKRIRVPSNLVEESLKKTPDKVVLHGRDPAWDILLEDSRVYFGLGGSQVPYFMDLETGKFRVATTQDLKNATRLGDALDGISFVMCLASASDVPPELRYLHELKILYENTVKPIIFPALGSNQAKKVIEIAAIIAGGESELRRRPLVTLFSCPSSPLYFSRLDESMIEFALKGLPILIASGPMMGSTGPATVVGSLVVSTAEVLFGIVLSQQINPGTPIIFSSHANVMDMRLGRCCYAASEEAITKAINAQMARYYNLPSFAQTGSGVDSKCADAQAGAEIMMNSLVSALAGVNLVQNVGTIAGGECGSLEVAVIGDEVIGMVERILRAVNVNDDNLALDIIDEVGPGKHFLSHDHTLKFFKSELYIPRLFNRLSEQNWIETGSKDTEDRAKQKVKEILREYRPRGLPIPLQKEIDGIIESVKNNG